MCRRWVDDNGQVHDEAFTGQLVWESSTALSLAQSGEGDGEVHQVDVEAAARFQRSLRDRVLQGEPEDRQYSYFAWVDWGSTVDDPTGVLRTWTTPQGADNEERYVAGSGWMSSWIREDWHRGRYDGKFLPIDEDTVERFKQRAEQRRAEQD